MSTSSTQDLVSQLASALLEKRWHLSTAESCTGGLVA
ncbi:MAG: CinA family protein, partial [Polynucleobacter victoriensis]